MMERGQWGLTILNHPAYIWDDKPVMESKPSRSGRRKPIEKRTKKEEKATIARRAVIERFEDALCHGHPVDGWRVVQSMTKAGYDPNKDVIGWWLFERLGRHLDRYIKKNQKIN